MIFAITAFSEVGSEEHVEDEGGTENMETVIPEEEEEDEGGSEEESEGEQEEGSEEGAEGSPKEKKGKKSKGKKATDVSVKERAEIIELVRKNY